MIKKYFFKLYISGHQTNSQTVIENLNQIFSEQFKNEYILEIIDVLKEPLKAEEEKIIVTPILIKKIPSPIIRFVGDFSNGKNILAYL